jgi:hypothetical protein
MTKEPGEGNNERNNCEKLVLKVIEYPVYILILLIWSIVGIALWIPMLMRAVAKYSFMLIPLTFSKDTGAINNLSAYMNFVISFYPNGFRIVLTALTQNSEIVTQNNSHKVKISFTSLIRPIFEIFIALLFWGSIVLLYEFGMTKFSYFFWSELVWFWNVQVVPGIKMVLAATAKA